MQRLLNEVVPQVKTIINKLNGDVLILITSTTYGLGKSTLSMMLAKAVWRGFDWRKHMSYSLVDFLELLYDDNVRVAIEDEGKRLGITTDFMKKEVKALERVLSETRKLRKCMIVNVGELKRLFKWIADERALVWIHILERGRFALFQARSYIMDGNRFGVTPETFKDVKSKYELEMRLRNLPSFCWFDTFPQYHPKLLPEEEYKEYERNAKRETKKLIKEVIEELKSGKSSHSRVNHDKIADEVYKNYEAYLKTYKGRTFIDRYKIQADFNVGKNAAIVIKRKVEAMLNL